MYGAVLRLKTELTRDVGGDADLGVLFLTNEGYSTMVSLVLFTSINICSIRFC